MNIFNNNKQIILIYSIDDAINQLDDTGNINYVSSSDDEIDSDYEETYEKDYDSDYDIGDILTIKLVP